MITCSFCNKTLKDRRVFGLHLSTTEKHNFSNDLEKEFFLCYSLFGKQAVDDMIEKYKSQLICTHEIVNSSVNISKLIKLLGIKRTSKEERKTDRYKNTYLYSIQSKYGKDIVNISQVPSIQLKKEETYIKNYGSYEKYLEIQRGHMLKGYEKYLLTDKFIETLIKQRLTCELKYNHSNFGSGIKAKEKSKNTMKSKIEKMSTEEKLEMTSKAREALNTNNKWVSKLELKIRKCLDVLNIKYFKNKHMWNYNYDLVFSNFILEVQGDFWHANPSIFKENDLIIGKNLAKDIWKKDLDKKTLAECNGYTMIYIWEKDVYKKSDIDVINIVKNKLLENGYVF